MDTLTHALSGALLARATAPAQADDKALPLRRRLLIGFLAAAAPDLDIVISTIGPVEYLLHHRGATHSLILLPLWAFLIAKLFAVIWRGDRPWKAYYGVVAMSLGIHIAGDWITSFGTMVFWPLSDARVGIGTTFIIDIFFSGIILAGLVASLAWRRSPVPAIAGLAALCSYVAFQGVLQQRAVEWGEAYARASGIGQARVTAQPRPVSPFNWMVIVRSSEAVRYSFINLVRREPLRLAPDADTIARLDAAYLPRAEAQWVHATRFGASDVPSRAKPGRSRSLRSIAGSLKSRCWCAWIRAIPRPARGSRTCGSSFRDGTTGRSAMACAARATGHGNFFDYSGTLCGCRYART
jgi:inner membrane protein